MKEFVFLISPEDADLLDGHTWLLHQGYIRAIEPPRIWRGFARLVLERKLERPMTKSEMPDHINGNKLDNRRENIRLASTMTNSWNRKISVKNTSGYRGVSRVSRNLKKPWVAMIRVRGKSINIGYFGTPEEAHIAYCKRAEEYFGEFASHLSRKDHPRS